MVVINMFAKIKNLFKKKEVVAATQEVPMVKYSEDVRFGLSNFLTSVYLGSTVEGKQYLTVLYSDIVGKDVSGMMLSDIVSKMTSEQMLEAQKETEKLLELQYKH
jgi:hypothetical protein